MAHLHPIPLDEHLQPLLLSMKIFGLYYERTDPDLERVEQNRDHGNDSRNAMNSGKHKIKQFCHIFKLKHYCGFIMFIGIINVLRYIPAFWYGIEFVPNLTVHRVMLIAWYTKCTVNVIIMFVACFKKDHFHDFVKYYNKVIADDTAKCLDYNPKCGTTRKYVFINTTIAWVLIPLNTVAVSYLVLSDGDSNYKVAVTNPFYPMSLIPRIAFVVIQLYASGAWLFPLFLQTALFQTIKCQFKSFNNTTSKLIQGGNGAAALFQIKEIRLKHLHLCKMLDLLENDTKYLIFNCFATNLFLMCFILYQLLKTNDGNLVTTVMEASWLVTAALSVALVSIMAASVHEAAHLPVESIYDINLDGVTQEQHSELMLYLSKLTGTTIGFSALGLLTVTKELLLTLAGLYLTYFFLLLQFKI